jgi:hypothetical protein
MANHFHVSNIGYDTWAGSLMRPFRTIQRAADLAVAGDTITVHEGTYREYVNPKNGGFSDKERITYEAAPGEKVIITGGEIISDWRKVEGSVYKAVIANSFFGKFNPYKEIIWGDWFKSIDRVYHLGEVYINGKSMFEAESLEAVINPVTFREAREPEWSLHSWYSEVDDENTTIYANFGEFNPADNTIEINVRRFCFWPEKTGVNYITVRGFHLTMASPNWAPPTALQEGLIGPNWSKGWIIENNEISNAKNTGISLGKEITTGHNEWVTNGTKHGTQRERDVIFNAIKIGWNKENVGSHIVRSNVIHDCEQAGICGHLGEVFSQIYDNHIYNIHHKRMFVGSEIGGIKLHASLDCQIYNNHIHNCDRGMWMDWQTQGTHIFRNLFYDNDTEDFFVEVSHGPYLLDNNIMLSMKNIRDLSQGGAYVHNLFGGFITWSRVPLRFTPYHYSHETGVHGLMTILGGDDRYYNNIFTGTLPQNVEKEKNIGSNGWILSGAGYQEDGSILKGLALYNECPMPDENWYNGLTNVSEFADARLPMYCGSNLYLNDAKPYKEENNSVVCSDIKPVTEIVTEGDSVYLAFDLGNRLSEVKAVTVTTDFLGISFEPELPYENPDGTPLCIEYDFFGNSRPVGRITVGPLENVGNGPQKIKIAELKSHI